MARKEEKGPLIGWDAAVGCLLPPLQVSFPGLGGRRRAAPCVPTQHHRGSVRPGRRQPTAPGVPRSRPQRLEAGRGVLGLTSES